MPPFPIEIRPQPLWLVRLFLNRADYRQYVLGFTLLRTGKLSDDAFQSLTEIIERLRWAQARLAYSVVGAAVVATILTKTVLS